jgi:hypothetical protein
MKSYHSIGGHEQWLEFTADGMNYNCTCPHGTVGRFRKDRDKPCWHVFVAIQYELNEFWKKVKQNKK